MTGLPWFRFYNEALNDPKVQNLPPPLFKAWINLLCLACQQFGFFVKGDIPFKLRMKPQDAEWMLKELIKRGLIDETTDGLSPHNWAKRQRASDSSTERTQRYRARRNSRHGDSGSDVTVTQEIQKEIQNRLEEDSDGDTGQRERPAPEHDNAMQCWNILAEEHNLPAIDRLTQARLKALEMYFAEIGDIQTWKHMLVIISRSDLLRGGGDENRDWVVTFDWASNPNNAIKILEGNYGGLREPERVNWATRP